MQESVYSMPVNFVSNQQMQGNFRHQTMIHILHDTMQKQRIVSSIKLKMFFPMDGNKMFHLLKYPIQIFLIGSPI